jgi:tripartite-type tricarboxylate transporter receptor subunit TctC
MMADPTRRGQKHSQGTRRAFLASVAGIGLLCVAPAAIAQDAAGFPAGPVRIIVPLAPGGSVDLTARLVAETLGGILGQTVVVENLPGGGGTVGATAAAEAPADGYTLVMGSSSSFAVNPSLMSNLPYDPVEDFEPVSLVSYAPNVMVVPPSLGVATVAEFVALAEARPGELNFASSGVGGSPHLAGELFKREAGIEIEHIPYTSSGDSMADLLSGRVDLSFATAIATQEQITAGALVPLAVTTAERVKSLPDVPTMAEAGYPNVQITAWNGLFAPAGTPPEVIATLSEAVQAAMRDPELVARLEADGSTPVGSTSEEAATFLASEIAKWAEVIRVANIVVE